MTAPPPSTPGDPTTRPPIRVVSTLDRLGLRYLSADVQVLEAGGCWVLPLAIAERDDGGEREVWSEGERLQHSLARAAASDTRLARLTVKTGQLLVEAAVDRVAEYLEELGEVQLLVDPELCERNGQPRADPRMAEAMAKKLLPHAALVVANASDAAALTGRRVEGASTMREAARALVDRGARAALVTGAHLEGAAVDWLYDGRGFEELGADRVRFEGSIRGAGGILSSVCAAGLARGVSVLAAAHRAREVVTAALRERVWVTAGGLLAAAAVNADAPPGYWIASAAAAARVSASAAR